MSTEPVATQQDTESAAPAPPERKRSRAPVRNGVSSGSTSVWLSYALGGLIPGSALAVGTVHVPVLLVGGGIATLAGILALRDATPLRIKSPIRVAALVAVALVGWTVIQALPLPLSWVTAIAPANGDVWFHSLDALNLPPPRWASLSLDPGATWVEALKGISYLGVMLSACVVASKRGASFGVALVFASALLCAATTIAHGLLDVDRVFGIYQPHYSFSSWHIGPFLNPNHLAGYLNLGTMCGLGLVLMRKPVVPPWMASLGVMLLIGSTITSASRGAVVLLPLGLGGLAAFAAYHAARHDARAYMRPARLLASGAAVLGLVLAVLGLTAGQSQELLSKDLSKLEMVSWAWPLIKQYKWWGIGRGAFETVFPAFNVAPGHTTFTHPENLLVQWLAEWGIIVGLVAAVALFWPLRPRAVGAHRSLLVASAWTGIIILLLQNLVDFSLELPSVGMAISLLAGSFWGDSSRAGGRVEPEGTPRPLALSAVACLALMIWSLALAKGANTPFADREWLFELSRRPPLARDAYQPLLKAAILRHPAEPYFPLVAAERAWRMKDENPIPYLQRTLERAATYGRAHLLLGEILFARNANNQALLEFKLAARDDPALITPAVKFAIEHTREHADLVRMVPEGSVGALVMDILGGWLHDRNPDASARFDGEALQRDPGLTGPRIRLADALIAELEKGTASNRCGSADARKACARELERHAQALDQNETDPTAGSRLRARSLAAMGRLDQAAALLERACDAAAENMQCLRAKLDIAASRSDGATVERLLKQIAAVGCSDTVQCATTYEWVGDYYLGRGNSGSALNWYERAAAQDGASGSAYEKLAVTAAHLGMHARAVHACERALRLKPGDPRLTSLIESEKAKALAPR